MSNIVYFNVPGYGHINPTLGIVQELIRRGEQVDYYCTEQFRQAIEFSGAQFHQIPTNIDWSIATLQSYGIEVSLEALPILLEKLERDRPKLIMFDSVFLLGSLLADLLDLPTVSTHIEFMMPPRFIPHISVLLAAYGIRQIPERLRQFYRDRQLWAQLKRKYSVKREKQNDLFKLLPDVVNLRGNLNIVFTSETWQIQRNFFDDSYIFTGLCYGDRPDEPDFPFFEIDGKSVIYIALGTELMFNSNISFFKKCLQAFSDSNHRVVMSVSKAVDIQLLGEIPPNFIVRNYVPQLEVLKYASVFISHGGGSSTYEALTQGVPLVVFPQGADHYLVANRVEELGAGIWVKQQNIQPQKLRQLVENVMNDAEICRNVERLSTSFIEAGGINRAVDKIQEFKQQASTL